MSTDRQTHTGLYNIDNPHNSCLVTWLLAWNITFWVKYSIKKLGDYHLHFNLYSTYSLPLNLDWTLMHWWYIWAQICNCRFLTNVLLVSNKLHLVKFPSWRCLLLPSMNARPSFFSDPRQLHQINWHQVVVLNRHNCKKKIFSEASFSLETNVWKWTSC